CQRQSGGRPPPLEPGNRTAHRRGRLFQLRTPQDPALQRLWRTGGLALCGHGPAEVLLMHGRVQSPGKKVASRPNRWNRLPVWPIYVAGFIPAVWSFHLGATGGLGADPVKEFEHLLGLWTLRFLILTLLITPIRDITGASLLKYRRALGLLAFYYGAMHFSAYMILDQALNMTMIIKDIVKRPFITIGMAALILMVPLAVTSNNLSIRKLGPKWNRLHRLIYVI